MQILKEEIRENILSAALDIFSTVGYENATMNQIAKNAGVAKSNLYRYYQSKSDIFHVLADSAMEEIQQSIMGALTDCFDLSNEDSKNIRKQLDVVENESLNEEFWKDPSTYYIKRIYPILLNKRKQILLFLKLDDSMGRNKYVAEITKILEHLFSLSQNLDMPNGFSKVMANSLICNICYIFNEFETEEEIFTQFCATIYYHAFGVNYFASEYLKNIKN